MTTAKKTPYNKKSQTRGPHLMVILQDLAMYYGIPVDDAIRLDNGREVLLCRGIYCYIAWKLTNAPLREIGALINVDHTTALYHRDKVQCWTNKANPKWVDEWLDYLEKTELWGKYEKLR